MRAPAILALVSVVSVAGLVPAVATSQDLAPVRAFRTFTRGSSATGLPASTVVSLLCDRDGTIWVATFDGLAKIEHGTAERLPAPVSPQSPIPASGPTLRLVVRRAGGIYVTSHRGLHTYDGAEWSLTRTPFEFTSLAEDAAANLAGLDRRGHLWWRAAGVGDWQEIATPGMIGEARDLAATTDGRLLLGGAGGVFELANGTVGGPLGGASAPQAFTVIKVAKSGAVWAGGEDGRVYGWTAAGGWRAYDVPGWDGGRIRSIGEDARGRIWVGGDNGRVGVGNERDAFMRWTPAAGLKASAVTAIAGDPTGGVWFGFNGAGLQQWLGEAWTHRTFWREPGDGEAPITFSVRPTSDGGFVAGVFNRGVWRYDGRTLATYGRESGISEDVRFAVEAEPGVLYVGTRRGIFEGRGGRFTRALTLDGGFVSGIFKAPDGRWFAATTADGIFVRDGGAWRPHAALNTAIAPYMSNIRDLTWRSNGELWIASARDLMVFRQGETGPMSLVPLPPSLSQPNALLERDRHMWVGGVGGIAVFGDATAAPTMVLTVKDGLPGETIYSFADGPRGTLWAGGSAGVGQLSDGKWTLHDSSSGLISEECNTFGLLVQSTGNVLVGTMSGLAQFDAAADPPVAAPLALHWRMSGMDADRVVRLPADDRRLTLHWAAPWPRPVSVIYRARLLPLAKDGQWTDLGDSPTLQIATLNSGTYTVEVAARFDHPGADAWWTTPITATVVVAPLWWETWWSRLVGLLLLGGVVALVIRWRTARLTARATELESAVHDALSRAKILQGLLPICAHCKKVRDDQGYWTRIEDYIRSHSEAEFSHGYCPDCLEKEYAELRKGKG
jgi:ligand-binding sensor domain-containing protein